MSLANSRVAKTWDIRLSRGYVQEARTVQPVEERQQNQLSDICVSGIGEEQSCS